MTPKKIRTIMRRVRNSAKGLVWIDENKQLIRLYSKIRGNEWTITFEEFELINS